MIEVLTRFLSSIALCNSESRLRFCDSAIVRNVFTQIYLRGQCFFDLAFTTCKFALMKEIGLNQQPKNGSVYFEEIHLPHPFEVKKPLNFISSNIVNNTCQKGNSMQRWNLKFQMVFSIRGSGKR